MAAVLYFTTGRRVTSKIVFCFMVTLVVSWLAEHLSKLSSGNPVVKSKL
jgi:hypothetical protein